MKCNFCDNPASVHVTEVVNQQKRQTHLCEQCARERDLLPVAPGPQINLQALMKLLVGPPSVAREAACPACGITYAAFKAEGRLGCEHDYDAFRSVLEPILERIHRSTAHTGKQPAAARRAAELADLQARMKAAIAAEDYEQAARLRDLIRQKHAEGTPG